MALEILGSRVLAPNFGSSVYVWGSLISTFLVALSAGYALGGRFADRKPTIAALSLILALAAALMLPSIVWPQRILDGIAKFEWDVRWSALAAAVVLFLPASLAMGMVTPFAVRIGIRKMEAAGTVSGGYSALSTAGSIAGTLAATFLLIPLFPVGTLLVGLAVTLLACAVVLARDRPSAVVVVLSAAAVAAAIAGRFTPAPVGGEKVLFRQDTPYHHLVVTQLDSSRWLRFDSLVQSGVDISRPNRSITGYDEALLAALAFRPGIRRVCVIGLGGGSFPGRSRACGPMPRSTPSRSIRSFGTWRASTSSTRSPIVSGPSSRTGACSSRRPGPAYDLIILDAFNSTGVPFHLTTREFFEIVRSRLTPNGIFAANFVGQLMGGEGRLFWATYKTIRRQFGQVWVASTYIAEGRPPIAGNILVFATISGDPLDVETLRHGAAALGKRWDLRNIDHYLGALVHSPEAPDGIPELTDAYAPVEALQNF